MTTTYRPGLVPEDAKKVPEFLRNELMKLYRAMNQPVLIDKILRTNTTYVETISGDLWLLANARWSAEDEEFYRIDITKAAFGHQIQAASYLPGEPELGYFVAGSTIWVASPAAYELIRGGGLEAGERYGAVGGWELGMTITQERNMTVGGMGIEMDGSGTFPYGRFVHNTAAAPYSRRNTGIAKNLYADFADVDDDTKDSWFLGYTEQVDGSGNTVAGSQRISAVRVAAGTTTWTELFAIDALTGWFKSNTFTVANLPAAATAGAGARAFVTNANATTFASIVAGGGANGVPVYSDGTNWRIG